MEKKSNAPVGELGLDLIVDKQGEVYIIEANDKPGYKTPERGRFISETAYRHSAKGSEQRNLKILEYARYLSDSAG
ncbi:MAG: YheC/YheD family protein [Oligoflexales bacterium]